MVHEKDAYLKNLALENIYKWCPTIFDIKCKFSWKVCSYIYDYPFRKKLKPLMSRPLFNYFHLYYRFFTAQTKAKVPIKMNFLLTVWLWLVCKFIRLTGHLLWRVSKFYSKNQRPWCKINVYCIIKLVDNQRFCLPKKEEKKKCREFFVWLMQSCHSKRPLKDKNWTHFQMVMWIKKKRLWRLP